MQRVIDRIVTFREERGWARYHSMKDLALGLLVEAGELADHFLYLDEAALRARVAEDPVPFEDELSDVLYWTLLMAHDLGIDLEAAFERKMAKNEAKYPVGASDLA